MSTICPVSDKVVEYLCADEGEPFYDLDYAAEFLFSSDKKNADTLAIGIFLTRCLDKDSFLAAGIRNVSEFHSGQSYEFQPAQDYLDFLDLDNEDIPVLDGVHIGPLSAETMLKLLELTHARHEYFKAMEKADTLREKFCQQANLPAEQPSEPSVSVEGNIFRPAQWQRQP